MIMIFCAYPFSFSLLVNILAVTAVVFIDLDLRQIIMLCKFEPELQKNVGCNDVLKPVKSFFVLKHIKYQHKNFHVCCIIIKEPFDLNER